MDYPLTIIRHPLAEHKLTMLRKDDCDRIKARDLLYELGLMLASEVTRVLGLTEGEHRDLEGRTFSGGLLDELTVVAMPIVRSGLVLGEAFARMVPPARMGHLGIHHDYLDDEAAQVYLVSIPEARDFTKFFILDSLVGTGETIQHAVVELLNVGVHPRQIVVAVLSVHDQGLKNFYKVPGHKEISTYTFERRSDVDENGMPTFGFANTAHRVYGTI